MLSWHRHWETSVCLRLKFPVRCQHLWSVRHRWYIRKRCWTSKTVWHSLMICGIELLTMNMFGSNWKHIYSRHERELNKSWRDSVDHSQWNIRRSTEGQFTRQKRTTLAQIRTGHCVLLKAYRKRIGLEDDGTCETCKIEEEDREHLRRKVSSNKKPLGRRSSPTRNLSRRIPWISSLSCGGLAGFRPTTVHSRRGNSTTTTSIN